MSSSPLVLHPSSSNRSVVYVYDPNLVLLDYIRNYLGDRFALHLYSEKSSLMRELKAGRQPDIVLLAWDDAKQSLPIFQQAKAMVDAPILLMSCTADSRETRMLMNLGARGVILKPFNDEDLEAVVEQYLVPEEVPEVFSPNTEIPIGDGRSFVRSSAAMRAIEAQASLIANSDIPVLILGESGTGKEVIANYIHHVSPRGGKTFLKVNCAAMPADLLESELFGYEQGAFTGAVKAKPGKFEMCNGGTIFLDEIGEMPSQLQAKLLHVLQDGTFSRLGGRTTLESDVRVIAATNINIRQAMQNKTFREDLYYRLNGFSLTLPALRERTEEINLLAGHFMKRASERYGRAPLSLSPLLLNSLNRYSWPGNLRELENVIGRYLILGDERPIIEELAVSAGDAVPEVKVFAEAPVNTSGLKSIVKSLKGDAEAAAIASALEETHWNRKEAAKRLKISYKALLYKIKNYNLATVRSRGE